MAPIIRPVTPSTVKERSLKELFSEKWMNFTGKPIVKDVRDSGDECRCNFKIQALKNIALINEISSDIMIEREGERDRKTYIQTDKQKNEIKRKESKSERTA